jgi:Thioredoxin
MRTIVALIFAVALYAQPPAASDLIARLEKKVSESTATVQDRVTLVNQYFQQRSIEPRRKHILWLAQNHPEFRELRTPACSSACALDRGSPFPDPEGFQQAAQIWRAQVEIPGANPNAIANAAWFFRFSDGATAHALLSRGGRDYPGNTDLAQLRGIMDAIAIGGITDPSSRASLNQDIRRSPEALKAYAEVQSSTDAYLIGAAADFIVKQPSLFADTPAFRDEDAFAVAERWLLRASALDPENKDWKISLSQVYSTEAGLTADPKWKVQLLRKSREVGPLMANALGQLAMAEFEVGNDEEAIQVAQFMLSKWEPPGPIFSPNGVHMAHSVLGRVALAQGKLEEAKSQLLLSAELRIPPGFTSSPYMGLAQELADAGARSTVIEFLERWRAYWPNDGGSISHNINLLRSPGNAPIQGNYLAGASVRGLAAPKLPIQDYSGKTVAVQFRNSSCKTCGDQFALIEKVARGRDIVTASLDADQQQRLVTQFEVETFPTIVWIGRDGRVADYQAGNVNEAQVRSAAERLGSSQKLPAPVPIATDKPAALAWSQVTGAESYVVQWDQRDDKGWLSDRDDHRVRVIPTHESSVALDPALGETSSGAIRWRVLAVNRNGSGAPSEWRELSLAKP